jgi:DNA (cytosine-5)-methyltransferase 1
MRGLTGRPRLLDLFCGAGGAAVGYHQAGFDVVGVDIAPQPRYPFAFIQADALTVLGALLDGESYMAMTCRTVDAIHASPPCQDYSKAMRHLAADYPRLIDPVRDLLRQTGLPWVIENVDGAPLPVQSDLFGSHGVELCGSMFGLQMAGLQIRRHRLFETSFPVVAPRGCDHSMPAFNPHNGSDRGRERIYAALGRADPEKPWLATMGVGWMHRYEGREAIPPAYTEHIGRQLLNVLERAA